MILNRIYASICSERMLRMKHVSNEALAKVIKEGRRKKGLTQHQLAELAGLNRSILSRMESGNCTPSVNHLLALSELLDFDIQDVIENDASAVKETIPLQRIAVAGAGYVGLSLAVLLSQNHQVTAVDISEEKISLLQNMRSPIQDEYIERYLSEAAAGKRTLYLTATTDAKEAYHNADIIIVATPTNYDPKTNFFDCSAVESVIRLIVEACADRPEQPTIVIIVVIRVGKALAIIGLIVSISLV